MAFRARAFLVVLFAAVVLVVAGSSSSDEDLDTLMLAASAADQLDVDVVSEEDLVLKSCIALCQLCNRTMVVCDNKAAYQPVPFRLRPPASVESVAMNGFSLGALDGPLFGATSRLERLVRLDLRRNGIFNFGPAAFEQTPALAELILDNNYLSLDQVEHFAALGPVARSLRTLKLNGAFNPTRAKSVNQSRSLMIDKEINYLLNMSNLEQLEVLELRSNFLTSFNEKARVNAAFEGTREQGFYEDVLCLLPNLRQLSLASNFIRSVDFDTECLEQTSNGLLELVDLSNNQLHEIGAALTAKLARLRERNPRLVVNLAGNAFICDCHLYAFYAFLLGPGSDFIANKSELTCSNTDTMHLTRDKRIVDANLRICSPYVLQQQEQATTGVNVLSFTTRAKRPFPVVAFNESWFHLSRFNYTDHNGHARSGHVVVNKLLVFLFACMVLSSLAALYSKCRSLSFWQRRAFRTYNTLDNDPTASVHDLSVRHEPGSDRVNILQASGSPHSDSNRFVELQVDPRATHRIYLDSDSDEDKGASRLEKLRGVVAKKTASIGGAGGSFERDRESLVKSDSIASGDSIDRRTLKKLKKEFKVQQTSSSDEPPSDEEKILSPDPRRRFD